MSIGTYLLKDDLHLATPPPHPNDTPVLVPNPLSTAPQAATAGTRLSLVNFSTKASAPLYRLDTNRNSRTGLAQSSIQEHPYENRNSSEVPGSSDGEGTSFNGSAKATISIGSAPAFGEGNSLLSFKDAAKRRKPKNGILKSNSSFISRCVIHENLVKRLQERASDGYFAFANINRAIQWIDLSSPNKVSNMMILGK